MPTNVEESLELIIDTNTLDEAVSPYLHKIMPNITQKFVRTRKSQRPIQLLSIVKKDLDKKRPIIVFSNKRETCDFISMFLNDYGIECISLNKSHLEKIRRQQFKKFQTGQANVLSATDLSSRGLDTKRVCNILHQFMLLSKMRNEIYLFFVHCFQARHVINYDFPMYISDYIHRCGRIGRVSSANNCFVTNFITSLPELELLKKIEHSARTKFVLPDVNANINKIISDKILRDIEREDKELFAKVKDM